MGKAYNPDDYLCQICVFKSCLHKSKGREIIRKKLQEINKKTSCDTISNAKFSNFCKIAEDKN